MTLILQIQTAVVKINAMMGLVEALNVKQNSTSVKIKSLFLYIYIIYDIRIEVKFIKDH